MSLDDRFYTTQDLDSFFINRTTGLPLAGGIVTFFSANDQSTLKDVYQLTGYPNPTYTLLPNPLTLSSVGTAQNAGGDNVAIYYFPFDGTPDNTTDTLELYYVTITDSLGNPQFTRDAWPNVTAVDNPFLNQTGTVENQISNSQFTRTFLIPGINTFTLSGIQISVPIAPDWTLVMNGTGTVSVQQIAISGLLNFDTSPPFVLQVETTSGITQCNLVQKLSANAGLWTDKPNATSYLASSIAAINNNGGLPVQLDIFYQDGTTAAKNILSIAVNSTFASQSGVEEIPSSNNSDSGSTGYVNIYISFPPSCNISISSVQVIPTYFAETPAYQMISSNRQQAFMGDYFIPRLEAKPIPSFLVGWDFPLNPAQFGEAQTIPLQASAAYIWDQTIAGTVNYTAAVIRDTVTSGINITFSASATVGDSVMLIQYIDAPKAKKMLGTRLSVNVNAIQTSASGTVTATVHLLRASHNATNFPTLPTVIASITAAGALTVTASNWTEVPRSNLLTATGTLNYVNESSPSNLIGNDLGFNGWEITDPTQLADTTKFAIVTVFTTAVASTSFTVNSISFVPGDIPTRPAPQTVDEVLRECQLYYEKSYSGNISPGAAPSGGARIVQLAWNVSGTFYSPFTLEYQVQKRTIPNVNFYSNNTASSPGVVSYFVTNSGSGIYQYIGDIACSQNNSTSSWTTESSGLTRSSWVCNGAHTTTPILGPNLGVVPNLEFHFTIDARLGLQN